jgi:hypothetical protein
MRGGVEKYKKNPRRRDQIKRSLGVDFEGGIKREKKQ